MVATTLVKETDITLPLDLLKTSPYPTQGPEEEEEEEQEEEEEEEEEQEQVIEEETTEQ